MHSSSCKRRVCGCVPQIRIASFRPLLILHLWVHAPLRDTMSSLRNSLHRKNHKERSQLAHRTRLGALEKHKDYVLRARDYHSKRDRIQRLRQKAAERNKDEFYFGMNRQKTKVSDSFSSNIWGGVQGNIWTAVAVTAHASGLASCAD
jgi:hypothetical protein